MFIKPTVLLLLAATLSGCVVTRSSSFKFSDGVAGTTADPTCDWVEVNETKGMKLLMLPLGGSTRQFDDSLFLCCASPDGHEPVCREAKWLQRKADAE